MAHERSQFPDPQRRLRAAAGGDHQIPPARPAGDRPGPAGGSGEPRLWPRHDGRRCRAGRQLRRHPAPAHRRRRIRAWRSRGAAGAPAGLRPHPPADPTAAAAERNHPGKPLRYARRWRLHHPVQRHHPPGRRPAGARPARRRDGDPARRHAPRSDPVGAGPAAAGRQSDGGDPDGGAAAAPVPRPRYTAN